MDKKDQAKQPDKKGKNEAPEKDTKNKNEPNKNDKKDAKSPEKDKGGLVKDKRGKSVEKLDPKDKNNKSI